MQTAMRRSRTNQAHSSEENGDLRRSATVNRVLGNAGTALDESVRRTLEPRFGHDFSSVRVHNDGDAARSASEVHARAWTVANHIAFAPGAYAPHSEEGQRLLAHELTHVAQQSSAPRTQFPAFGRPHDAAEREADSVAPRVMRGESASVATQSGGVVQRQFLPDFDDPWPEKAEAARIRAEMPLYLEWRGTHPAGFELSREEITAAEIKTGRKAPEKGAAAAGLEPKFVLHDTDSSMTVKHFEKKKGKLGPQGAGAVAWVPNPELEPKKDPALDPVITREFYEEKRPTATGFEKGEDIIDESKRETMSRIIWGAASKAEQTAALDLALAGTGLPADDAEAIKKGANGYLRGGPGNPDGAKTTASWAAIEICKRASSEGAEKIADPDAKVHKTAVKNLETNCKDEKFVKWIASRSRIGERANVEIAQLGEKQALPATPYGPTQYEGVANLYLAAALAARRWPFVTTHRYEDRDIIGGHDDPRCYDVDRLYRIIAEKMTHPTGTIYGLVPVYGGGSVKDANVTWTKALCHTNPPGQKQK